MTEVWPMSPPSEMAVDPLYDHMKPRFESGMDIDGAIQTWEGGLEQPRDSRSRPGSESGEDSDEELRAPQPLIRDAEEVADWSRACVVDIWNAPPEPPTGPWGQWNISILARHGRLMFLGSTGPEWLKLEITLFNDAVSLAKKDVPLPFLHLRRAEAKWEALRALAVRPRYIQLVLQHQHAFRLCAEADDRKQHLISPGDMYRRRMLLRSIAGFGIPPAALIFARCNLSQEWIDGWKTRAVEQWPNSGLKFEPFLPQV